MELMMTLAVSVAREDPLMSYYPTIKELIIEIVEIP